MEKTLEEALREALKGVKVTYNPGIGCYENCEEWRTPCMRGDYQWPVRRDPIFTPIFTAIFGSGGFSLFGVSIGYAQLASAIAATALSIGLQYALAPKPPKPEDGRQPIMQAIPYCFFGVGESRASGAFMLWEAINDKMLSVQALVAHPIESIEKYYLNDDEVELGQFGIPGLVIPPSEYPNRYYRNVYIYTRLGAVPETPYAEVVAQLGAQGVWTNDHRGDGQASLAMICISPDHRDYTKNFPNGKPTASVVGRWAKCWDFRTNQDPDDPSTWAWTKNSVLILAWHLCFNPFGEQISYKKAILPVLDMWQEEADVCDEDVPIAGGGTRKRYECSGTDRTDNGPKSATNAILASMDGWMATRGDGAILIVAGKYREKYCVTLTDAELLGYDKPNDVLFDDEVNRFTPKFNYPATDYTTTDTDFFDDLAAQLISGRVLPQEGHYDWVTEWRQARALGKRDWLRIQQKVHGQLFVNLAGINAAYAPWVRLIAPSMLPSLLNKVVSNRRATIDIMRGAFNIEITKMPDNPSDIDAWDPEVDEGSAPPVPAKPVSDGIPIPEIDSVAVRRQANSVYIHINLIDPAREDVTPTFHYRIHDIGGGTPGPWSSDQSFADVEPDSGLLSMDTNAVPGDQVLDYELAYIGANGSYGAWTATDQITTTVDTVAPIALLTFGASGGTGSFTANFGTENDAHLSYVAIYKVVHGATISPRPSPIAMPSVSKGISYAIPISSAAGNWDIYVEPFNGSSVPGPLSGPANVTVS
jgi:hypothetical protein